jgi:hypothetical protein
MLGSSAVSLAALLLIHLIPGTGPCRVSSTDGPTRTLHLTAAGLRVDVPADWVEDVEEHVGITRIQDDRDGACRLVVTWHDGGDTAPRIRRVHERLYLDQSQLPATCGEERIQAKAGRKGAVFGEYDRDGRRRVYGMFWSSGTTGFAAVLTCPRGTAGDWRVALPLFRSIRRTTP